MTTEMKTPEVSPETIAPPQNPRRNRVVGLIPIVAIVALLTGWLVWKALMPRPSLEKAMRMVAERRLYEAKLELLDYLRYAPSDPDARMALASILLNHTETTPEATAAEAEHLLDGLNFRDSRKQAAMLVLRGKALDAMHQIGRAEDAYSRALRVDPNVGEAGWLLLQTYYIEGRRGDARRLALRLAKIETDPRDRARLLLEPCRPDARPLSDAGVVATLEPARRADPQDRPSALAYYRALAGDGSGIDRALVVLRAMVAQYPHDIACWNLYLEALGTTGQHDELALALKRVPEELAKTPQIARHRGRLAMEQRDFDTAITNLREAIASRPYDVQSIHRLADALKNAGKLAESEAVRRQEKEYETARLALRGVKGTKDAEGYLGAFEKAMNQPNFGIVPDLPLYREFASIRERMGHPDEAAAWHRLIVEAVPDDAPSLAAIQRLEAEVAKSAVKKDP